MAVLRTEPGVSTISHLIFRSYQISRYSTVVSASRDVVGNQNTDGGDGGYGGGGNPGSPRHGGDEGGGDGCLPLPPYPDCCWQATCPQPCATLLPHQASHQPSDPVPAGPDSVAES